jgi:hypothetical protein
MGAFMALPVAALIMSFASNFTRSYEVVYHSPNDDAPDSANEPAEAVS